MGSRGCRMGEDPDSGEGASWSTLSLSFRRRCREPKAFLAYVSALYGGDTQCSDPCPWANR